MPRVSVCCSVLNQSQWLPDMIASVLVQTFRDFEFIIVDDGSTENIKSIVESFKDDRIIFHQFEKNKGVPHGINCAFRQAKGDYIQPLAADERLSADKFEMQVKYLDEHPEIAAVFGLPKEGPFGPRPEWEVYALGAQNRSRVKWIYTMLNVDNVPLGGCSALWRRSLHDEIGYFRTDLLPFVDHEFYCRIIEKYEIRVLPHRWAISIPNPTGISMGDTPEKLERVQTDLKLVRELHPLNFKDVATKITVAIPVKDMAQYVRHAINSILIQTHQNFEILVVDDGSRDGTYQTVLDLMNATHDKRINLHQFTENRGDREACNNMLERATGDYFMCLSADDLIEPTYMAKCLERFHKDAALEMVASQTTFITDDGKPYTEAHPFKTIERATNKSRDEWKNRLFYGNVYFGAGMFRTKALRDIGGWKQDYKCLADYAMYLEILARGDIQIIEEDLTLTRIRATNMSMGLDQDWLANTYSSIKARFYRRRMKVIIATPFYEVKAYSPYIVSLTQTLKLLTEAGIDYRFVELSGDSYVHRARNTICDLFLRDPDATDLFFVDSDMAWTPEAFVKMCILPDGIVGGSYPMKNNWVGWTSVPKEFGEEGSKHYIGRNLEDGSALIEADVIAGGFLRIKRAVLEKFRQHYPDLWYVEPSTDKEHPEHRFSEFFFAGTIDHHFFGEDHSFSKRMREMGERIFIYPNVTINHYGVKGWNGNLDKYLKEIKGLTGKAAGDAATQSIPQ